jgi:hypothetical protein
MREGTSELCLLSLLFKKSSKFFISLIQQFFVVPEFAFAAYSLL